MITLQNIIKTFGTLEVLKGINLTVGEKEIVTLVGPSGAGKTTLLQIAGTLDKPDSGKIFIQNEDILKLSSNKLADFRNKNLGFIFQFHQLLPEFTALENVCIPAYIAKTSKTKAIAKGKELLDFMGLSHRLNHKPSELSGGEKQRVAVARALINNPQIIFADEPSGSLDSQNKKELHQLFFDLREMYGQTFLIVTHDEELAHLSDYSIHMKDGHIISQDSSNHHNP